MVVQTASGQDVAGHVHDMRLRRDRPLADQVVRDEDGGPEAQARLLPLVDLALVGRVHGEGGWYQGEKGFSWGDKSLWADVESL